MRIRLSCSPVCLPESLLALQLASTSTPRRARRAGCSIASEVLEELRDARDQSIPDRLLERAYAIAVIPALTKVAFFAGGRHGKRRAGGARQQGPLQQPESSSA